VAEWQTQRFQKRTQAYLQQRLTAILVPISQGGGRRLAAGRNPARIGSMIYLFLVAMFIGCTTALWHGFTHPVEPIFWFFITPMAAITYLVSGLMVWGEIVYPEIKRYQRNKKPQP
jgi:hypothetical protein